MERSCVIVFPLYKAPDKMELMFLQHGAKMLKAFDMVIACPESLEITTEFGTLADLRTVRFNDEYFKNIQGYNRLLLSAEFYRAFINYDYLLIHQADVYIFRDELNYWCKKGYAYIGAPWFRPPRSLFKKVINGIRRIFNKKYGKKYNKVGNGGLSLRNVEAALTVLSAVPEKLTEKYRVACHHMQNEDVFWSFEAPLIDPAFIIPDFREALNFAIEFSPEAAFKYTGNKLPFGCHAPLVHGSCFWQKYIPFENKT